MRRFYFRFLSLFLLSAPFTAFGQSFITPQEYAQRRQAVIAKLDSNSAAIFAAAEPALRNDDVLYPYHQNSSFLYLTGIREPRTVLLLLGNDHTLFDSIPVRQILFIPVRTHSWSGPEPTMEERKRNGGFSTSTELLLPIDSLPSVLNTVLPTLRTLYYTPSLPESFTDRVAGISYLSWREAKKNLEQRFPNLEVRNSATLLQNLRLVKSQSELHCLQQAVDKTIALQRELMKNCTPGMREYELHALLNYSVTKQGIDDFSFPAIIATGKNAMYPHYEGRGSIIQAGDLVLIDCGVEVEGYASDITRTFPANGKFTSSQKLLYELVLSAHDSGIAMIQPGETLRSVHERMFRILANGLLKLGIIASLDSAHEITLHGFCHFLGIDVHDVGNENQLFEPGMVLTVEPAVYIPDSRSIPPQYRGIGIRIEDDILVTENGCSVLSALAPTTTEEIELTMKKVPTSQNSKANK